MKSKLLATLLAGASLAFVGTANAQNATEKRLEFPEASPPATVKQRIGITDVEVNYNRPSVKGRKIFGGLVPYGEIWRTGANRATRISFSTPAKVGGQDLPAGNYEVFSIPNQNEWTLIFQAVKDRPQWGSYAYDQKNDTARVTAKAERSAKATETFQFSFGDITGSSASLNLDWENTHVSVPITVDTKGMLIPQIEAAMAKPDVPKQIYFPAAIFYLENDGDLNKALEWMNAAIAARPGQMWMVYRKGLILEKLGDKAGAKAAAEESLALAQKDEPGELREEYIRLNKALLERVK